MCRSPPVWFCTKLCGRGASRAQYRSQDEAAPPFISLALLSAFGYRLLSRPQCVYIHSLRPPPANRTPAAAAGGTRQAHPAKRFPYRAEECSLADLLILRLALHQTEWSGSLLCFPTLHLRP